MPGMSSMLLGDCAIAVNAASKIAHAANLFM
jgi:hypothetical protein